MTLNSYPSYKIDIRTSNHQELDATKSLNKILIKILVSDKDSILRINRQEDSMLKLAFSIQKDLNIKLANIFKKHLLIIFKRFSIKNLQLQAKIICRIATKPTKHSQHQVEIDIKKSEDQTEENSDSLIRRKEGIKVEEDKEEEDNDTELGLIELEFKFFYVSLPIGVASLTYYNQRFPNSQ